MEWQFSDNPNAIPLCHKVGEKSTILLIPTCHFRLFRIVPMHAEKIYISPKVCLDARCEKTSLNIKSWSNTFEHSLIARNDFSRFRDGRGPTGAKSGVCPRFVRTCVSAEFGSFQLEFRNEFGFDELK